ncbi:MAG: DUF1648 domain-containing protein [Candidatus Sulfotelmatobacter sp.]
MYRDFYKPLTWLMWLVLPITALGYWSAWDQLPARMAVHFDANWQPNGFTSREGALTLGLGIMAFLLVVFTVGALATHAVKAGAAWVLLVVFYVTLGFLWFGNHSIIEFNLRRQPQHSVSMDGTHRNNRLLEGRSEARRLQA